MQGKKTNQEKLFISFQLSDRVPAENFYRQLKDILDLSFLYRTTYKYYGREGQKSIDPVVFMKLMLVGYLENLNSDRRIISTSGMRMDILYFLGYNLDEELPWHSTLSRTRKLYGEDEFLTLFKQVLKLCVDQGLISGKRQAVDSAIIRANASIHSMIENEVMADAGTFSEELDKNIGDNESGAIIATLKPQDSSQDDKMPRHTNQTHFSPSDPDARITKKPGKSTNLYYRSQVSVDTASHFITYIQAFPGNSADNVSLPEMVSQITKNMTEQNLQVEELLADTGYSSGKGMLALIDHGIEGYIPNTGSYKKNRDEEGFIYDAENDRYICKNGAFLTFRGFGKYHGRPDLQNRNYRSSQKDCKVCPFKSTCAKASREKKIVDSADKYLYHQMQEKIESKKGRKMKKIRSSTVEPVFGSLINYTGLRRINTKGLKQANKCMIMAAVAYNLKKLIKINKLKPAQSNIQELKEHLSNVFYRLQALISQRMLPNSMFQF
jgi:transposase